MDGNVTPIRHPFETPPSEGQAVEVATAHNAQDKRAIKPVGDYQTDNVSIKVLRIILSYVDYVNRTVWYKDI